jgi:hypothetical protein
MENLAKREYIRNVLKNLDGEFKRERLLRRRATVLIEGLNRQHKYIQKTKKTAT